MTRLKPFASLISMSMNRLKYIVVEGPIGVGKSSLTRILAEDFGARALLDEPDANPFLPAFYENPEQFAFQTQLYFLLSRYQQQKKLQQQDLFDQKVVCDYLFAKDLLFAQLNLTEEEYQLYLQIYRLLDQKMPKPDAVIFLQANTDVLLKRIKKRDKDYESGIDTDYVERVSQLYSQFFFQYNDCPLLVVNVSDSDFIKEKRDYDMLKDELLHLVQSGKSKHYVTIIDKH